MADKTIGQLVAATNVTPTDLFVLEQSGTAKKLTGQILENWLVSFADGHGGIQSIEKTSTQGLVDVYTITLADTTTVSFTVTNGKAISSVTTYYAVSSSGSTVPSSWSTTRQSMTSTNRYLWSYQHIAFNDNSSIDTVKTVIGVWGDKGDTGATGRGIVSLAQTSREPGQYTLYTFTMSDGTTETFYSYDGVGITGISKTSSVGLVDLYTISYSNGTSTEFTVTNAKSITSVTQTGSSGLTDVYTVAFNDGTSTTFNVRNGSSISSIEKTSTQGLVDVYTVSLTDGTSTTFTVTNAKSITRIEQTGGTHAAGTTDTYTIYFNDGDTAVFTVYNGTNGTGSVSAVDGIQPGGNQNVTLLTTGNGAPTTTTPGQLYQRYFDLSTQILYICIGVDTTTTPNTYSWAGTGVPVDASLSSSSENPVQNKVITAKVGTAALNTTAQNLSGAVNELDADLAALPATAAPLMDGTAAVGTSQKLAREDHVHPHDTLITNRNLLDNWYFVGGGSQQGGQQFPINERGLTSYTDSATGAIYTINRWRIATPARSLSINSDSISVTRNTADTSWSSFSQYIGNKDALKGKTLTLSALVKNDNAAVYPWITLRSDAGNIASVSEASAHSEWTLLQATGTAGDSLNNLRIEVYPGPAVSAQGASIKIKAIKLEIGSEQTLAHQENGAWVLNEIPDYETELVKCKTSKADPNDTYANNIIGYNVSHRNLLDNWYFVGGGSQLGYGVFPINQRGQTTYSNAGVTIDRWKTDGTLTVNSDGISTGGTALYQRVSAAVAKNLLGKTVTASALLADGTLLSGTATFPASISATSIIVYPETNGKLCYALIDGGVIQLLRFQLASTDADIVAAKVEIGSTQTLAHQEGSTWVLNEIPDYETELLHCKTSTADPSDTYANGSVEFGNNIGIVQNTNTATQNISNGQYVIWHGALYTARTAIASGATLSSSNLTAVQDGGLNDLRASLFGMLEVDVSNKSLSSVDHGMYYTTINITNDLPQGARIISVRWISASWDPDVFITLSGNGTVVLQCATASRTLGSNRKVGVLYSTC